MMRPSIKIFFRISILLIIAIFLIVGIENGYKWSEQKANERTFSYVCKLVLPRLQLGATREVQDTLISLFIKDISREDIFPKLTASGKVFSKSSFATDHSYTCQFDSIPQIQIDFEYNLFRLTSIQRVSLVLALMFLGELFLRLSLRKIEIRARAKAQVLASEKIAAIASQVAHDIRSPLSALNLVVGSDHDQASKSAVIKAAISRINSIADELLNNYKSLNNATFHDQSPEVFESRSLMASITRVVDEKRVNHSDVTFEIDSPEKEYYGICDRLVLERVISNLIQNAIDAYDNQNPKVVQIFLRAQATTTQIIICDRGKGIPSGVLNRLGERGFTFGKIGGTGLGLHYAKSQLELWGGKLSVTSKLNEGTMVSLLLNKF